MQYYCLMWEVTRESWSQEHCPLGMLLLQQIARSRVCQIVLIADQTPGMSKRCCLDSSPLITTLTLIEC